MGKGRGYDGHSKSINALDAEERGLYPASIIARKLRVPVAAVRAHEPEEWHHTSSRYNVTDYYHLGRIRGFLSTTKGQAILAEARVAERTDAVTHAGCRVEWLEWSGTRKHPKATERKVDYCTVAIKGQTATVTLPDGTTFRKRITTRGFTASGPDGLIINNG